LFCQSFVIFWISSYLSTLLHPESRKKAAKIILSSLSIFPGCEIFILGQKKLNLNSSSECKVVFFPPSDFFSTTGEYHK